MAYISKSAQCHDLRQALNVALLFTGAVGNVDGRSQGGGVNGLRRARGSPPAANGGDNESGDAR